MEEERARSHRVWTSQERREGGRQVYTEVVVDAAFPLCIHAALEAKAPSKFCRTQFVGKLMSQLGMGKTRKGWEAPI